MPLTELPFNLPGKVYRSPMPFSYFDRGNDTFKMMQSQGVSHVVLLTDDEEALESSGLDLRAFYGEAGMEVLQQGIVDFSTPTDTKAFSDAVDEALDLAKNGKNVTIHCYAGIGRTGMFAALMARRELGMEGDEAIAWVRKYVPDAVQTPGQRQVVVENAGK
ncbi:MAG: tyrosine-protein phosphatase [Anaerolineae bacterium]|nr:tyrosine-protein phosphatase [Anaerolineae bacterium]